MKCFYHSADLDGHCSGALIKMMHTDCELVGINYGDEFPWDAIHKNETVWMVDFCLQPFSDMLKLQGMCGLIWIDHHKSALEEYGEALSNGSEPIAGLRRDGIGACQVVYEFLTNKNRIPTYIKLLAEYDVWNHSDPRTLSFQYGMRFEENTWPDNQDFWSSLQDVEKVNQIIEVGGIILKYEGTQNKKFIAGFGFDATFDGLKCICANKGFTNSKLFESVWDNEKYDAMLTFSWRKGQWTISLYSDKPNVDVSVIAKKHGGGGHRGAAGFQTSHYGLSSIIN